MLVPKQFFEAEMALPGPNGKLNNKLESLKVLIVDDQAEIRSLIREVLVEAGIYQIFEAGDGKSAMQFVDADFDMVNLIVCDWNMPGMNGVEFLRQIRSVFPDLPFLMITGRCDKKSVIEAKLAGVSAYISKPFSPIQLEMKIRNLVDVKTTSGRS